MIMKATKVCMIAALLLSMISLSFVSASPDNGSPLELSSELVEERPNLFGNLTDEGVKLEWDLSLSGVEPERFRVYRSLTSSFKSLYKELDDEEYEFVDTDVEEGRTYHYWITALFDENQESRLSKELEIRVGGKNVPLPPRNLEAFPGDEKVRLRWDKPLDCGLPDDTEMGNYILYREKEGEELPSDHPGNAATEWTDDNLKNNKKYTYYLKAQNSVGMSESTEKVSFTPTDNIPRPRSPRNFKVFTGRNRTELTWDPPEKDEHIYKYRIYKEGEVLTEVNKHTNYFVDEKVIQGSTYEYSVRAVNVEDEESINMLEKTISLPMEQNVGKASDLNVEAGDQKIELSWKDHNGSEKSPYYNIYRGESEDDLTFVAQVEGTTRFTDRDLENKKVYHYRIRAVNSNNTLGKSSEMRHGVPIEQDEDNFSPWTLIGFAAIIAVGIFIIVAVLKRREPKGPQVDIKEKGSEG
ncbi:MAG: fibronectin type III domain-containing protein [Candidatus Aenigmatarchaeota archaeon]